MNKDELIIEANDLNNALIGLESYIFYHISAQESITRDDLSGLHGLIAAIKVLSDKHATHILRCLEVSE